MRPHVTMFADASVRCTHGTAGWGYWIKGDGRPSHMLGGPIKPYVENVCIAELIAIRKGLETAINNGYFLDTDKYIMIQSDSTGALHSLRVYRKTIYVSRHADSRVNMFDRLHVTIAEDRWEEAKKIIRLTDELGLEVIVRHVKGHTNGNEGRSWVNKMCDRLAKKGSGVLT